MLFHLQILIVPSDGRPEVPSAEPWLFCEHFQVIPFNVISRLLPTLSGSYSLPSLMIQYKRASYGTSRLVHSPFVTIVPN
jgi:hypothetical protein